MSALTSSHDFPAAKVVPAILNNPTAKRIFFIGHTPSSGAFKRNRPLVISGPSQSPRVRVHERRAHFDGHLKVSHFPVLDVPAGLQHFEPLHELDALGGLGNRILDRIIGAGGRRADQFEHLVGVVISHGSFPQMVFDWSVAANVLLTSGVACLPLRRPIELKSS
uniref:Uncharacterized protein n=1 Tax=Tanacetum cinerariifolium TaxID=118510 RepID=A0A699QH44_TANCI|nr:hypothetical protein [Tanacetum cinerariifolium]